VLATVLVSALLLVTVLGSALAAAVLGQRRVETAADLGALAGAYADQRGAPACAAAADMVRRNGAVLVACANGGAVVTVRATRRVPAVLGTSITVSSTARAGPTQVGGGPRIHPDLGRTPPVHG
jgi:secretion/DNA translocation related TadE-like protein